MRDARDRKQGGDALGESAVMPEREEATIPSRRRLALLVLTLSLLVSAATATAAAENGFVWRYAPAAPPPAPAGQPAAPYPVPLGTVGQISFWSPNHGLLITGGTAPAGVVEPGLYVYDGVEWRQLSTVCGGADGRIAWAGPDEFWTISDQRAGQILGHQESPALGSVSLCHFLDGRVVASYAMPLGQPDSYLPMDAAACLAPNDCWFAGKDGQGADVGSFHLHWDGSGVTAIYDPEDHAVTGMSSFQGELYEGLAIGPEDSYLPGESHIHPKVIREIAAAGGTPECAASEAPSGPFCNAFPDGSFPGGSGRKELPIYPSGTQPDALGGFDLATDGSPQREALGEAATQLWAAADPVDAGSNSAQAPVTILHDTSEGAWTQVIPTILSRTEYSTPLGGGEYLFGSETDEFSSQATDVDGALAPEPGAESAWLSLRNGEHEAAYVARLQANGTLERETGLPNPALDPVGYRGEAGPIACAATADCWMATTEGWLFHLGEAHERDDDPYFSQLITERPPDASVPVVYPDAIEEAGSPPVAVMEPPHRATPAPRHAKAEPLVKHVKSRFVHGRELIVSFALTARAHVQMIGRRKGKIVAHTRQESLPAGQHQLALMLDPARWPTKLQFEVKPLRASGPSESGDESPASGLADTIGT